MEFNITVEKRYFFGILGAILFLAGIFAVYAYGTNEPEVFGHSVGELDIKLDCAYAIRNAGEEPVITSGDANAIESIGIGGGFDEKWGLGCVNDYKKTGCYLADPTGSPADSDVISSDDGQGCLTDDEEYNASAGLSVVCCKIVAN